MKRYLHLLFGALGVWSLIQPLTAHATDSRDILQDLKNLVSITSGNIDIQKYYDLPATTTASDSDELSIEDYLAALPIATDERTQTVLPFRYEDPISLTEDERYWVGKLVEAEAADEPLAGKVAVAVTLVNRLASSEFPGTIMEVMKQTRADGTYQYSPWTDGSIYLRDASEETLTAVSLVFDEGFRNLPVDAIYFHDYRYAPNCWQAQTREHIATILNHVFTSSYAKGLRPSEEA